MTFPIHWHAITACGESCTGCKKQELGVCGGCIASDGYCAEWAQSGRCPIHACAKKHQVRFCGLCGEFPCEWLLAKVTWKTDLVDQHIRLAALYHMEHMQ